MAAEPGAVVALGELPAAEEIPVTVAKPAPSASPPPNSRRELLDKDRRALVLVIMVVEVVLGSLSMKGNLQTDAEGFLRVIWDLAESPSGPALARSGPGATAGFGLLILAVSL